MRELPISLLPDTVNVHGEGDYGAYVRYIGDEVSVFLGSQDDAEQMAFEATERLDVAHAEVIIAG